VIIVKNRNGKLQCFFLRLRVGVFTTRPGVWAKHDFFPACQSTQRVRVKCVIWQLLHDCVKKLMKGNALRKYSLHEKTAASDLLKLFISSNDWCHTTVAPKRMNGTPFSKLQNTCSLHDPRGPEKYDYTTSKA